MSQTAKLLVIGIVIYGASFLLEEGTIIGDSLRVLGFATLFMTLIMFLRSWRSRKKVPGA